MKVAANNTIWRAFLAPIVLVGALVSYPTFVHAADQEALDRADRFLSSKRTGKEVLSFVHCMTTYHGHSYRKTLNVTDVNGNAKSGHFAVVYRFEWDNGGLTDVAFLCDAQGRAYQAQILWTNAVLQQPFVAAKAVIDILGHAVLEFAESRLSDADRRAIQRAIDNSDVKELMEFALAARQAMERS